MQSRFRFEKDAEYWCLEVAKFRELEPELEKARKRINDLERESNQHFSSIFDAPEEALGELRHLKQELLEVSIITALSCGVMLCPARSFYGRPPSALTCVHAILFYSSGRPKRRASPARRMPERSWLVCEV
jgi:hypothetical protein